MPSVSLTEFIHLLNEAGEAGPLFQFITIHYHIQKQWKNKK